MPDFSKIMKANQPKPAPLAPAPGAPAPKAPLPPVGTVQKNPVFELQRKRASQQLESQGQIQNDAIQRRFAAQGGLNSGAAIKAQETARQESAQNRQNAMEAIDTTEAADMARQQETLDAREFARSERIGSQDFSRLERLDSQNFTAGESAKLREFEGFWRGEEMSFKNKALDIDTKLRERGMDQADMQLDLQSAEAQANWAQVSQDDVGGYDNWRATDRRLKRASPSYRRDVAAIKGKG